MKCIGSHIAKTYSVNIIFGYNITKTCFEYKTVQC